MLKMLCAASLGLSPTFSMQFTTKLCFAVKNRKKITNIPYFEDSVSFSHRCWYPCRAHESVVTIRIRAYPQLFLC